jgi:hypothetical protein
MKKLFEKFNALAEEIDEHSEEHAEMLYAIFADYVRLSSLEMGREPDGQDVIIDHHMGLVYIMLQNPELRQAVRDQTQSLKTIIIANQIIRGEDGD